MSASASPAAVDHTGVRRDELLHRPYSCTPAECCVSHCRPEIRTVDRFDTNKVLGWPARNLRLLLLLLYLLLL